ncbi:MAG TPA: glycine/sarcosine/betaine reductase component B subunit [Gaiellaceae bacterium]|nr:glycine/sarcosine/betaine reductase component B subunit [Gaiellaceae bacterium]
MAWEVRTFAPDVLAPDVGRIEDLTRAEPALAGVDVAVVEPGEPVRVTHVLDAVEPRIRSDGRMAFPSEERAGEGVTNRISDVVVLSCLDFPGEERPLHEQESIVDLSGPAADLTPFGSMRNVVLTFRPGEGAGHQAIDSAVRRVTLRVAEILAEPTLSAEPVHTHTFALGPADDALPAVAALIQLSDLGQLYQLYLYGTPVGESGLPKLVDPAEVMDGAVTAGEYHWAAMRNPTLFFQLNSLVRTLYREHGKRLRFAGVVLMRGYEQSADDKQRAADAAARVAVGLGVDGVVITTDAGGNSHTDTMLTCRACENAGVKTAVIVCEETDLDATEPILTDWVSEADCIVSTGNVEQFAPAWKPERVLGGDHFLDGTPAAEAGPIPVRNYLGAANQMGQLDLGATSW